MRKSVLLATLILPLFACDAGSGVHGAVDKTPDEVIVETPPAPVVPAPVNARSPFAPAEVPVAPVPPAASGVTEGSVVTFDAALLADRWLFGIGADPNGFLAQLGGSGIGIAPIDVRLSFEGGHLVARAWDETTQATVPGDAAIVASYPASAEGDLIAVDFQKPATATTIEVFGNCGFDATSSQLAGAPVFADGLLTWPVDETFTRTGSCPGWLPRTATGLDVPFLRHQSAAGNFASRAPDATVPFGFFMTGGAGGDAFLDRLGAIADGGAGGRVVYHLSTNFPELYAQAAIDAFEAWNDVLEPITGIRPFRVERATADMIAWDPRYHFVIWDTTQSGGAMAPFGEDPGTGEVVQNLVIMWFGDIDSLVDSYTKFYDKHPDVAAHVLPPAPAPPAFAEADRFDRAGTPAAARARHEAAKRGALRVRSFTARTLDADVVRRTWQQVGLDASRDEIASSIVTDFLVHELGHNLGLRHNFKGSIDRDHMNPGDTSSSTMDYVVGMLTPGGYDIDAMRYAYGSGPERTDALFCTDEDVDLDPGCAPWDFGHPVLHWLSVLDSLAAQYPLETPTATLSAAARNDDWASILTRVRDLMNTDYEAWDPEAPASVFSGLLDRIICEAPCSQHSYLRGQYALYLMYTRHQVQTYSGSVWVNFPAVDETQAALLMTTLFELVTDETQPQDLKSTIIQKLPTAAVPGAAELLQSLRDHFAALPEPTAQDTALLQSITAALGG